MPLKKTSPLILSVIAVLGASIILASALLSANQIVKNTGNVKAVGVCVYKDSGCSQKVTLIEWGSLYPGEIRNYTVYIRNEGSVNMTLSMKTDNWNSTSASSYISLTWNRENYRLVSGILVSAVLTLSVSSNATGVNGFSFDIIITGTEST